MGLLRDGAIAGSVGIARTSVTCRFLYQVDSKLTHREVPIPVDHTERGFEQAIEHHLLTHGYKQGDPSGFYAGLAGWPSTRIRWDDARRAALGRNHYHLTMN